MNQNRIDLAPVHASHCSLHPMHYTIIILAHVWLIFLIGHVYVEPELEVPTVEDFTNLDLNQDKLWCINQCSLSFILNTSLCFTCLCIIESIGIG
jgi:hypothetical protein